MQITLNEAEIKKAIINYVANQGISLTGSNVVVSLTAGRGPNGHSASIEINNDEVAEVPLEYPDPATGEADEEPVIYNTEPVEDDNDQPLFGS